MPLETFAIIPLSEAVLCESCSCITNSKGEICINCHAKSTLMNLNRCLNRAENIETKAT